MDRLCNRVEPANTWPGITPPPYSKYVLTWFIVGSILNEDALSPYLLLSRYVIYLCVLHSIQASLELATLWNVAESAGTIKNKYFLLIIDGAVGCAH